MSISIIPPNRRHVSSLATTFALQQDNWNDYGFNTLYHLHYQGKDTRDGPLLVGGVKILRRGQTAANGIQILAPFDTLDPHFCSVGSSLDYYQRLNEIDRKDRDAILSALRDVVAHPNLQAEFETEEGWSTSLFRDNPAPQDFLTDAAAIYSNNFAMLQDLSLSIRFTAPNWQTPLVLQFDLPNDFGPWFFPSIGGKEGQLPRRVIAIVGRNGSGKSTLLARLARVAFASPSDRLLPEMQLVGSFDPPTIGFIKIIAISYSAFDNFIVPGLYESELRQIADDMERGNGRYIYCGLRDIVAEVRDDLTASQQKVDSSPHAVLTGNDRRRTTRLKTLDQLSDEFGRLMQRIATSGDEPLLASALQALFADPSFADIESRERIDLLGSDPKQTFLNWSTGHKIALHVIASLVAHATRKSLVLFDEPEMHLHPSLTAALMHAVRLVLEERNAVAVLATHSPVVLQETLARHVRIVRRTGSTFEISTPELETFGENVGILTYDAFGLTASATDFHVVLDRLIRQSSTIEEIDKVFTPGLSSQARAYVMAGLARKVGSA